MTNSTSQENDDKKLLLRELFEQGINDLDVLAAIQTIPREAFVPANQQAAAYENRPLPIGYGQTISQPLIIAAMTSALGIRKNCKVLEVGTGSGYQTAILAKLAAEVFTVERFPELSRQAEKTLLQLGYANIHFHVGDGTLGLPDHAPFDRILVTAAGPKVPKPLADQLVEGGRLVLPIEDPETGSQRLYLYSKRDGQLEPRFLTGCRFVPLVGAEGFDPENESIEPE